jgi:outer membrane protein assembly factor BamB
MRRRNLASLLVIVALAGAIGMFSSARPVRAEDWPQWRGPRGDGRSGESGLPVAWSEHLGVRWKCPLPEWGNSTPVIWGDAIFVTAQENDERLLLLRIDKATGKIVWTREVGRDRTPTAAVLSKQAGERRNQKFHASQNLASPSPVTDGQVVCVHFGNGLLAAYDFDGRQLWRRNLQEDHGPFSIWWGRANSPVLHEDLVISVAMQDSCADLPGEPSPSYLVAHDKRTGEQRWFTLRPTEARAEHGDAYTTPIFRDEAGRREMIVMGGHILDAYDPSTGKRLWWLSGLSGNRLIPSPVAAGGMIYAVQGMREPLLAVRPGGDGPLGRGDVVWRSDPGTSDSPSPIVWGELLFMVTNDGVLRCYDALDGRLQWKERIKGGYRASPVAAEGRIYWLNTTGLTTVISASSRFVRLTENALDDETFASPAVSDGCIFIRGRKHLYCLSK